MDETVRRMAYALYIASFLGAVALLLMTPRRGAASGRRLGALLGAATLGGLWLVLARFLPQDWGMSGGGAAMTYYYVFSAIGIAAAVLVITHTQPVYSALWFVMVVLSSAGLFLLLEADFMALALVIIYGGAILVTYVFVIMLAAHAGDPRGPQETADYDAVAWEPVAAIAAGFLLLAVLLAVLFQPLEANPDPRVALTSEAQVLGRTLTARPEARLRLEAAGPNAPTTLPAAAGTPGRLRNVERVGLDLFEGHPLGLELAGVVLLVALVGAVVIARQRVETEAPEARA